MNTRPTIKRQLLAAAAGFVVTASLMIASFPSPAQVERPATALTT